MSNLMMQRRGGDALTRATTILAGCFFLTSLLLAILASHRPAQQSILDVAVEPVPSAEQAIPATEGKNAVEAPAPVTAPAPATPKAPVSK